MPKEGSGAPQAVPKPRKLLPRSRDPRNRTINCLQEWLERVQQNGYTHSVFGTPSGVDETNVAIATIPTFGCLQHGIQFQCPDLFTNLRSTLATPCSNFQQTCAQDARLQTLDSLSIREQRAICEMLPFSAHKETILRLKPDDKAKIVLRSTRISRRRWTCRAIATLLQTSTSDARCIFIRIWILSNTR